MPIKRTYFDELWEEHNRSEISILLGARQVGKSTLMRQLEQKAKSAKLKTAFYDLEQPSDLNKLSGKPQNVIDALTAGADCVFIDEFHYLKNASKIFKAIYDGKRPVKIYASGSSSLEIHKHLKESLAGRFRKHMIFPLTLKEWGKVKGFKSGDYLIWGGLPGLIHEPEERDRLQLLENILSAYITKDIKGLIKEENIRPFNSLLYCLAQSQGSVVVASSLARETGLSEPTVARHLEIMSQTYVLHCIQSYSTNLANELKKSKKFYLYDIGIRNMILKDVRGVTEREDKGVLFESAVFLHVLSQLQPNMELRFWRTKKGEEVDFVLVENRVPIPIEIKSQLKKAVVPKGMVQFLKRYPKVSEGIVYNDTVQEEILWNGRKIYFRKWQEAVRLP
jgi:hypothetical protein